MKWFIPGNVPSSKNGKRWTGKYLISSKTVMKYRKDTAPTYKKLAASFKKQFDKYELPVIVCFKFIRGTRHKFDYINPAQTVQDDMVKYGWIEDDNMKFIIPRFEKYEYDKDNPGVEIKILKTNNLKNGIELRRKASNGKNKRT
tara:strand:- start:565 stop:996 length:432 start_codon:yes stop_codon:yes gene_type:complete